MNRNTWSFIPLFIVALMLFITGWAAWGHFTAVWTPPVEITILYSPEGEPYLPQVIDTFNASFADGINPLTGRALAQTERTIKVMGRSVSSGVVHQGIINAIIAPNQANVERPTIFSPSTSIWLDLVNHATGRTIFTATDRKPTGYGAVVIAIWESRLKAIQAKTGRQDVGWKELIAVMDSPNGWADYGIEGRRQVYYGHTDPYISSTGLATLLTEFMVSAHYRAAQSGNQSSELTLNLINDETIQAGVRDFERMVKHYFPRTTEMREYIAQGPAYVDFVALQEDALIYINQGKAGFMPPEKLVALYPKEGSFWFDHPFGILQAEWVSLEQQAAARIFTDYVLSAEVQQMAMELALMRPTNPAVKLGYPFVSELGVDPSQQVADGLTPPPPAVVIAAQASWQYVKKQGDILLLFDISGSMEGDKLSQAKTAALQFIEKLAPQTQVAVAAFNDTTQMVLPFTKIEGNPGKPAIQQAINGLAVSGGTAMYDALITAATTMQSSAHDRIRAIILLSDGQDTASQHSLQAALAIDRGEENPLFIFPVAYGNDADIGALNALVRVSTTKVFSGDPATIGALFELLSGLFS